MRNISYYRDESGKEHAKWPGKTVYVNGEARKEGQFNLGLVIDKSQNIFWNRKAGYITFNPLTEEISEAPLSTIPSDWREVDQARRRAPVCIDFGDTYFLDELIKGIGYDRVLDSINYANHDRLMSMLYYYVIENKANRHAETWYKQNLIRILYPKAGLASQRISEFLASIGTADQKRAFLKAHIRYVLEVTGGDICFLIDSTGLPNSCNLPITRISNHEGDVNLEFRLIALVQKSTGLPLFYHVIEGNVVDVSTIDFIIRIAKEYGIDVSYVIGDAGYCCPANIERLVLAHIDFMTRINPTYQTYSDVINRDLDKLNDSRYNVNYHGRTVRVYKTKTVIGKNKETGEDIEGYVYLCKDMSAHYDKAHRAHKKYDGVLQSSEIEAICEKCGIFAIVTTRDLLAEEVLPEYYVRQKVEQFFDFGKNYAKFIPVREQNMETLGGHILLGFIASFIITLINNRLNVLGNRYTTVPLTLIQAEGVDDHCVYIDDPENGRMYFYMNDNPIISLHEESPITVFYTLRGHKCEVFEKTIIPCPADKTVKDAYNAFKMYAPAEAKRIENGVEYLFNNEQNHVTKKATFSQKASKTDAEIEEAKKKASRKKLKKLAEQQGMNIVEESAEAKEAAPSNTAEESPKEKIPQKRGRPVGSKNKKTLEREAREKEEQERLAHRRGRKPGSKNKKTLEREEAMKAEAKKQARNAKRRENYARKKSETVTADSLRKEKNYNQNVEL